MCGIVTGVTSDGDVPSTHLVYSEAQQDVLKNSFLTASQSEICDNSSFMYITSNRYNVLSCNRGKCVHNASHCGVIGVQDKIKFVTNFIDIVHNIYNEKERT